MKSALFYIFHVLIVSQNFCIGLAAFASFMDCGLFQIFPEHVFVKNWKKTVEAGYLFIYLFNGL